MNTITQNRLNNQQTWYIIDAKSKKLGRLATLISYILTGKNQPIYNPSKISNNYIIVINTKEISISGRKKQQKRYKRHSSKPGSLKIETLENLQQRLPNRIVQHSVKNMLPKGKLGRKILKNLKLYSENQHPHIAQNPIKIEV
uniref:Large ribosomal subunit protein uL13c n=1 Tax=Dichotomaria marginata TaxID=268567 RepID=A0A1G4NSL4_9FLOR|nr:Ribosomal protein L13 [Dichotomaria marginata]SCW21614.1 Ribosomal protein L13 [Dichotomaria marginata]